LPTSTRPRRKPEPDGSRSGARSRDCCTPAGGAGWLCGQLCGRSRVVIPVAEPDGETERNNANCTTPETAMHPTISYEMNRARIAELHHQAQRDGLAYAVRQARRARRPRLRDHLTTAPIMAARRLLTMPRTRTP